MPRIRNLLLSFLLLSPLTALCRTIHLNETQGVSGSARVQETQLDEHGRRIIEGILNSDSIQFDREQSNKLVHFVPPEGHATVWHAADSQSERRGDLYFDSVATTINPMDTMDPIDRHSVSAVSSLMNVPLDSVDLQAAASDLVDSSSRNVTTSLERLNSTFINMFTNPRGLSNHPQWKEKAQKDILRHMHESSLETKSHPFVAKSAKDGVYDGVNLVGILPGRFYGQKGKDTLIVVGAHYDTVDNVAGIDDNASGVVAVLELARLLASKPKLNHTIMFVAFDHEEKGLVGSKAFVNEYLIPNVLKEDRVTFLAAYVIDMALTYDPSPDSQYLPVDIKASCPAITAKIAKDGNRGDFVAVWLRKDVEYPLYEAMQAEWTGFPKYKLRALDPPLPASKPEKWQLLTMSTFTRSDHASFWYHTHQDYPTLPAVLVTDLGLWRGDYAQCYHKPCDDTRFLSERNLKFFKNTVEVMARLLSSDQKRGGDDSSTTQSPVTPRREQTASSDRNNNRGTGRGPVIRGSRDRGTYYPRRPSDLFPSMSDWPSQFPPLNIPIWARV